MSELLENRAMDDAPRSKIEDPTDLLCVLDQMVSSGLELPLRVTLSTGAALVTGTLISEKIYVEALTAVLRKPSTSEESDLLSSAIADGITLWADASQENETIQNRFFHLKDVQIFSANGQGPAALLPLWRCRFSAVVGFALGEFSSAS